jgi:predicted signal transduction protein with EAL and GGDEF domain
LRTHVRLSDLAARWGGEEFVVAYTSTDFGGARIAAERLRQAIEGIEIYSDAGDRIAVTVSMGLASLHSNEELSSLVDRADKAMYVSKNAGRNRVSVCSEDTDVGTGVGRSERWVRGYEPIEKCRSASSRAREIGVLLAPAVLAKNPVRARFEVRKGP